MHTSPRWSRDLVLGVLLVAVCTAVPGCRGSSEKEPSAVTQDDETGDPVLKLQWFIPDGMRADPDLFQVFQWAQEGQLPNIGKLMERGSWGYSIPTFPSHTPTNFATLLTGALPEVHGVADGPMHVEGFPLAQPSVGGFSSTARKVPAIWSLLERSGRSVFLLSMPGSTPPELQLDNVTVRGRWGGWGADFPSLIFEADSAERRAALARGARLFFLQQELTRFVESSPVEGGMQVDLSAHGMELFGTLTDSDGEGGYDRMVVSKDGKTELASLAAGEWSDWIDVTLAWREIAVPSHVRVHVIKLESDGFFRIRLLVNALNRYIAQPGQAGEDLVADVGPMVDFVDNFPPQLIYFPEDKRAFVEEATMSLQWHRDAVDAIHRRFDPDVLIHDTYTPNQMLTSRWWLGYVDPNSRRHGDVTDVERQVLMDEILEMYRGLDEIVGRALDNADEHTIVVLSSDHGAAPLDRWVRLNNFFASQGWLEYTSDPSGAPVVDWERTQVVYLKMDNVFIHPDGLGGAWTRASGPEYETLRDQVVQALTTLQDADGGHPTTHVVRWEDVEEFLDLPTDRVGDLVIANRPGYGWNEEITVDGEVFTVPLKSGYKQAMIASETPALWTPFVIAGPGVKANHAIAEPIAHVDQAPTILKLMGQEIPAHAQGKPVEEIFE